MQWYLPGAKGLLPGEVLQEAKVMFSINIFKMDLKQLL